MEITRTQLESYIGQHVSSLPRDYSCDGYWPIVDADTLMVTGIADGSDDLSGYDLADYIDGRIVRGDAYAQCLVAKQPDMQSATVRVRFLRDRANGGHANFCQEPTPEEWGEAGDDIMEIDRAAFDRICDDLNCACRDDEYLARDVYAACIKAGGKVVART